MGKVYIVGAGPGDPDLLTIKAMKCIQKADVILYDRLINKEVLQYANPETDLVYCGKLPNYHTMKQETINKFLVKYAQQGKIVTRLKGGDPFLFGRGAEEAESLVKAGISFEVIPGITSGIAAPAYAGIPVTHRDVSSSCAFLTGHFKAGSEEEMKWKLLAQSVDTLAIYMGIRNLPDITEKLIEAGKSSSTPVALIEWGTYDHQRTVTGSLKNIVTIAEQEAVQNPSMIIVGEVVNFHKRLDWFTKSAVEASAKEALV
jgi:uroporphyrin-III C-methyltransferase